MPSRTRRARRALDLCGAIAGLLLGLPLLPLVALAIKLESRGPVFHRDLRLAEPRGRPFARRRFRVLGRALRTVGRRPGEHPRLTRVGRLLRRTGLEGWPQLLNVLLGDMGLVGPRALSPACARRLAAECPGWALRSPAERPGIFGPAQFDRPGGATFFAALCEKLLVDAQASRRLARLGVRGLVQDDLLMVAASLGRRLAGRRAAAGNDVIRVEHPRRLVQVAVDPEILARAAPVDVGAEVVEDGELLTAFWYPRRRPRGRLAARQAEWTGGAGRPGEGALHQALRQSLLPGLAVGEDRLRLDLPGSLNDVHRVCEHLLPLWEALADRTGDPRFPLSMSVRLVEALAAAAATLEGAGRIVVGIAVGADEVRLEVTAQARAPTRPPWVRATLSTALPARGPSA